MRALKKALLAGVITELTICLGLVGYGVVARPTHDSSAALAAHTTAPPKKEELTPPAVGYGLPVRLKIPKLNIDATIEQVGLTTTGDMDAPKGPATAGWLNLGPRPGHIGSAVMDGHFGYKGKIPAVFDKLHTLQRDDLLYVEDEAGATIVFVVRELKTYKPNDDATNVFSSTDGLAHLNLVTCKGAWDKTQKTYSTRLVVFTDKQVQAPAH